MSLIAPLLSVGIGCAPVVMTPPPSFALNGSGFAMGVSVAETSPLVSISEFSYWDMIPSGAATESGASTPAQGDSAAQGALAAERVSASSSSSSYPFPYSVDLQTFFMARTRFGPSVGLVLGGGMTSFLSGALVVRVPLASTPTFRLGADVFGGYLNLGVGTPMAYRLSERWSLISHPTVSFLFLPQARVPLGIRYSPKPHFHLELEAATRVLVTPPSYTYAGSANFNAWVEW